MTTRTFTFLLNYSMFHQLYIINDNNQYQMFSLSIISLMEHRNNNLIKYFHDKLANLLIKFIQLYIIFISSNMLQVLDFISDNSKAKSGEKEYQSKQQKIKELFQKLKERNIFNDIFIKKFIKRTNRKKLNLKDCPEKIQINQKVNESAYETIRQFDKLNLQLNIITKSEEQNEDMPVVQQSDKQSLLHKTNHTNAEETLEEISKIQSLPIIDQPHSLNSNEFSERNLNQSISHLRNDKQIQNYIRNVFFKEIVTKTQQKKNTSLNKISQKSRNSHHGRINTDIESNEQKYQLSIKSLVFGNQQALLDNKIEQTEKGKWKRLYKFITEKKDKLQTMDKKCSNKSLEIHSPSKVTLPSINNPQQSSINNAQLRNKRCLQHFIRFNHQKSKREIFKQELKTKIETQTSMTSQPEGMNRIGFSFRINTIQIKRHY